MGDQVESRRVADLELRRIIGICLDDRTAGDPGDKKLEGAAWIIITLDRGFGGELLALGHLELRGVPGDVDGPGDVSHDQRDGLLDDRLRLLGAREQDACEIAA
ncbi:hypothetical protein, partial [Undibacterium luofuense]|uniref:hypothetical protein n=1 Tax=Undibacterium luofuense TaxID=2828733 RepID=UPI0030EB2955